MNTHDFDNQRWRFLGITVVGFFFICLVLAMPAEALRLKTTWAERVDLSEKIVLGEVVEVKSYWNPEKTLIYTDVTLLVDEHIKGNGLREITITILGGTVGDDTLWVSDTPQFSVGDYGVILLESSGQVTGGPDGVYSLQKPMVGTSQPQSMIEDRFLSWIKAYVNDQTQISFEEISEETSTIPLLEGTSYATISGVSPSTISAGTNSFLTVSGSGFGASRGTGDFPTIAFRYKDNNYRPADNSVIQFWSDGLIRVDVFTFYSSQDNYNYSPGSWSDTVAFFNSRGNRESFYPLTITFGYGQAKWTTSPVSYYVNATGGPSGSESAIQAAANTWNGAGANFSFSYAGTTSIGVGKDNANVISFADLGSSSIIAQASIWISGEVVTESDIQFNTGFAFSTDTPTPVDKMDLQSIVLHELGHWLFLTDLYGANDTDKVMYGIGSYGQMKRTLASGDQAGIQWIYPYSPCTYSIEPVNSPIFSILGGTGSFNVTTQSGCYWTATENLDWVAITPGGSGTGSGTVTYTVSSNAEVERSGAITIWGYLFTGTHAITQTGPMTNLIQNPGFESGNTVWIQESGSYNIITQSSEMAHSGSWLAWFGGYSNASDLLYQRVTIPSWATQGYVQFWYYIATAETEQHQYDIMTVEIRRDSDNALLKTLKTLSNLDKTSGWVQSQQFDVTEFIGQTVRLRFGARLDATLITSFLIDDVTLAVPPSSQCTLTVNINPPAGGSVAKNPDKATYVYGDTVQLTATAGSGYTFSNWSGDASGSANPINLTMDANKVVTANFCPIPGTPLMPSPSNGAAGVSTSPTLTWAATSNTDSYDVYLGTTSPPTSKVTTIATASYSPSSALSLGTTYYWQVVSKNNCGNSTTGPVWSFTTHFLDITPNEGTIGTIVTINGNNFGASQSKVLIGNVVLNILSWGSNEIQASLNKTIPPGTYSVTVQPKTKGAQPMTEANVFTVRTPEIDLVSPNPGSPWQTITISGRFFGTQRGKVTIGVKACNVKSWKMDTTTGTSTIQAVVPKGLQKGTTYDLKVINAVGSDAEIFTAS